MSITNERREEVSQMMRKAGFSEAEISCTPPLKSPKTRKNGKRGEYIALSEWNTSILHGKFPPKEVWTKFPQCPRKLYGTQRGAQQPNSGETYTKDTGKEFKYESGVHRVENFEVDPEHERALNLLRERGRIDLVQQGLPRNAKIHNYLLSHTDVGEVGTGIFQYRMIKEEEE